MVLYLITLYEDLLENSWSAETCSRNLKYNKLLFEHCVHCWCILI